MTTRISSGVGTLAVVPLGSIGEVAVRMAAANLQAVLNVSVDILAVSELPEETYEPARRQYDASRMLDQLDRIGLQRYRKVLGIVAVDLCIPILTYVFGEAQLGGRAAVVSSFRLRSTQSGQNVPLEQYYERLAKVALHEVAHTLSLYHCEESGCLMNFSSKLDDLDRLDLRFCERCEFSLRLNLRKLDGPA
jgi:archaemetzincin